VLYSSDKLDQLRSRGGGLLRRCLGLGLDVLVAVADQSDTAALVWREIVWVAESGIAADSSVLLERVGRVHEAQARLVTVDNDLAALSLEWVFLAFVGESLERREVICGYALALFDLDGVAFRVRAAVFMVVWLDDSSSVLVMGSFGVRSKCSKGGGCNADELSSDVLVC